MVMRDASTLCTSKPFTFSQVTQLDEILRRYTAFTEASMPGIGPMKGQEPIEQKFPFPGVMSLKGEVINQSVKIERENLEIARRDAVNGFLTQDVGDRARFHDTLEQLVQTVDAPANLPSRSSETAEAA